MSEKCDPNLPHKSTIISKTIDKRKRILPFSDYLLCEWNNMNELDCQKLHVVKYLLELYILKHKLIILLSIKKFLFILENELNTLNNIF